MIRYILIVFCFCIACKKSVNEVSFKGVWVNKDLLDPKLDIEKVNLDSLIKFPIIVFNKEQADSVIIYEHNSQRSVYETEFSYNSYFVHFNRHKEYFMTLDYTNNEMVFSILQDKFFSRYVKLDTHLTQKQILDKNFDLKAFIRGLR